jgi:hypothetical protein
VGQIKGCKIELLERALSFANISWAHVLPNQLGSSRAILLSQDATLESPIAHVEPPIIRTPTCQRRHHVKYIGHHVNHIGQLAIPNTVMTTPLRARLTSRRASAPCIAQA